MNIDYHIDKLRSSVKSKGKWKYNPITIKLIDSYTGLGIEQAMIDYIANGDLTTYVDKINQYDKIIWEYSTQGQASNPVSTRQTKILSTWRESIWTPIWARLRSELQKRTDEKLVVIQNMEVAQTIYSDKIIKFKDVDGGIGIQKGGVVLPLLAVEDKGGHACSTMMDGIQGQGLQFHQSFPYSLFWLITDNNFSVKEDKLVAFYQDVGNIICERGDNRKNIRSYNPIRHDRLASAIKIADEYFSKENIERCVEPIVIPAKDKRFIRKIIDEQGTLI